MPFDGKEQNFVTTEPQTATDLRAAFALLRDGAGWCQASFHKEEAAQFCSIGALLRVVPYDSERWRMAYRALEGALPGRGTVMGFNDTRAWPEVRGVWERAIASAQREP